MESRSVAEIKLQGVLGIDTRSRLGEKSDSTVVRKRQGRLVSSPDPFVDQSKPLGPPETFPPPCVCTTTSSARDEESNAPGRNNTMWRSI